LAIEQILFNRVPGSVATGVFEMKHGNFLVILAAAIAGVAVFALPLQGLTYAGHGALALLVFAILVWSSESLSLPVASLIILLIQPILGIVSFENSVKSFANPIIFLLLGGFIIAEGVTSSGLVNRFAYGLISRFGGSPRTILLIVIFATGLLSAWINNLVAFAMALPVLRQIITLEGTGAVNGNSNFAKRLVLGASYGSLAGGVATEIGTGPTLIAASYANLSFGKWMIFGIPLSIVLMLMIWRALILIFPVDAKQSESKGIQKAGSDELAPLARKEKVALAILLLVIALLATSPITGIDSYAVTLFGAALFFLAGIIDWRRAQKRVDWGVLVFFASALSVGNALLVTGAATWVINAMMNGTVSSVSPLITMVILMLIGAALTQVVSNVGLAAIMVPIVTTLATEMNLPAATFAVPTAIACSLSFMLPMSDPTIAMAHGTGYVRTKDIFRAGLPVTILAVAISIPVLLLLLRFVL
jgi:sodium-dependent dicarboxylate transporter 2/3/5